MKRFSNLKSYELVDIQNTIQDIYHLKKKIIYQIYMQTKQKNYNIIKNYLKIFTKIFKNQEFKKISDELEDINIIIIFL